MWFAYTTMACTETRPTSRWSYSTVRTCRRESIAWARLSPDSALLVVEQAVKALAVAHSAGIVHRDVKPSNLFLAVEGGDEVVKVLDFGIAKQEQPDGATTSQGVLLGSPAYMSPEQARGHSVDLRSDLWSLGVVVFEMLSGDSPFSGTTVGDSIAKICWEPLPLIRQRVPELPERYQAFFDRALARDLERRFQSAQEFLQGFRAAVDPNLDLGGVAPARTSVVSVPPGADWGRSEATVELSPPDVLDRREGASLEASSHVIAPAARPRWVLPAGLLLVGTLVLAALALISSRTTPQPELAAPSAPSVFTPEPSPRSAQVAPSAAASTSAEPPASAQPSRAEPSALAPAQEASPAAPRAPKRPTPAENPAPRKPPPPRDDTFGI